MSTAEIVELQRTVANIATSVAVLTNRLPPLATEDVELRHSERSNSPDLDPLGPADEPHAWLGRPTEGRPREVDPALLDFLKEHWGPEGRAERCRAALTSFPRPRLPFATVPELNPEMKALAKERSRRPEGGSEGPANVAARDQALRESQDGVAAAMGPLVGLLEIGLTEEAIDRKTVADHVGAATAHLGRLFASLSRERREGVIARVAPDLRQMVAHDGGDEGSPLLFGEGFLGQLRTRNETIKVLREARQPPPPAAEPAAKRSRSSAAPGTSAQSRSVGRQPFHGGPPSRGYTRGAYLRQGHRGNGKPAPLSTAARGPTGILPRSVEVTHPRCLGPSDNTGVQAGVCTGTSDSRVAQRADPRAVKSGPGGSVRAGQKGSGLSGTTLRSEVPLPLLHSTKEGQQDAPNSRSPTTKRVGATQPLQDGGVALCEGSYPAGRLHDTYRPEGRIPVCPNLPPGPPLARLPRGGQGLPLERAAIWPQIGTESFHKTTETSRGLSPVQGTSHCHVLGRYPCHGPIPLPTRKPGTSNREPPTKPGFCRKLGEVGTDTSPGLVVSGTIDRLETIDARAPWRETRQPVRPPTAEARATGDLGPPSRKLGGTTECMPNGTAGGFLLYQEPSNRFETGPTERYIHDHSYTIQGHAAGLSVVDPSTEEDPKGPDQDTPSSTDDTVGQLAEGVGSMLGGVDDRASLDTTPIHLAHQCPGADGSLPGPSAPVTTGPAPDLPPAPPLPLVGPGSLVLRPPEKAGHQGQSLHAGLARPPPRHTTGVLPCPGGGGWARSGVLAGLNTINAPAATGRAAVLRPSRVCSGLGAAPPGWLPPESAGGLLLPGTEAPQQEVGPKDVDRSPALK
ncbi:uncharacterized protein LOC121833742 isoform X1 [Ixodes scapularis]|uniref:uncharacterized protein LOC121833742 isoform X1 n=1 Tax=Ixodes scapularis TaxID=6945 RepID=UPI001C38C0C4|nr:uncharacterized protein LOC121833742 isoform X1 [Ixodes scapularis]